MKRKRFLKRALWLSAAVAAGTLLSWQLASTPSVEASPVDQQVRALPGTPASFADIIEAVSPAVVNISVSGSLEPVGGRPGVPFDEFEEFMRRFFDQPPYGGSRPTPSFQGMGSGFVIDPEGYVVTNNHVVERASEIAVIFNDGKRLAAKLVGTDSKTDLAVLKVDHEEPLPYATFGDSDHTRTGDWVIAIGNPFGLGGSASTGIVSARGRDIQAGPFDDFLQIDAPINRGNSGGPLFDVTGRVIGINTAIFSPNGGNVGVGFAIPSNLAKTVVDQLRTKGRVERGWLGVAIQPVDEDIAAGLGLKQAEGALVASVVPGGPAEKAGVLTGDVLLTLDGQPIVHLKQLTREVAERSPGERISIELYRRGDRKRIEVRLGEAPGAEEVVARTGANPEHGLGLSLAPLTPMARQRFAIPPDVSGALVADVDPAGAAAQKGVQPGDVIVMVGQTRVASVDEALREIESGQARDRGVVLLQIVRHGEEAFVAVPVA